MERHIAQISEEHILACLSSAPSNAKIIKTAAQMAKAFGGKFTAIYVNTPESDRISRKNRERLQNNIKLAMNMGAEIATVYGEDIAQQIIEFARLSKITKIVLGRSRVLNIGFFCRRTLVDKIIKAVPKLDVYIIPDTETKRSYRFYGAFSASHIPSVKQIFWTIFILLLSTALGYAFHMLDFAGANSIPVYMLGVLITALITKNNICSAIFSFISVFLFDWIFTEPMLSIIPLDLGNIITFIIMLTVSLIMGTLANKLATSAKLSANAAYRTNIMLETIQLLQNTDSEDAVISTTVHQLGKLLSRNIVVYPIRNNALGKPQVFPAEHGGDPEMLLTDCEINVANWVYENGKRAGAGTDRMNNAHGIYFSVGTNDTVFFVVGIEAGSKTIEYFESSILLSILGESALAIENLRNAKEKEQISLLAKNEKLRANLLRAISHDLRTPLTSISGNAENLLANFDNIDSETRRRILTDLKNDAEWLISLVENLLSVSRISEGRMNINMSAQLVDEVIAEALHHIDSKAKDHRIVTDIEQEFMLAKMDARLISQVIINLVDNAVKYTPRGSLIMISAKNEGNNIKISVADDGPGIPDDQKKEVFSMFFTGNNRVVDCRRSLGLGLPLCESIVNAHGGKLVLMDNQPHGCIFTFTLEKSEVNFGEQ